MPFERAPRWFDYMLNVKNPKARTLGVIEPHGTLGPERDGKWQLKFYDPNLTRAELMEPKPVEKRDCSPMLE